MPMLFVQTNLPMDQLPTTVGDDLTDIVSKDLAKPKQYIFVSIQHVPFLSFQGTTQPGALVELKSIGFTDKAKVVSNVTKYLESNCKIPASRVGMTLVDLNPAFVGIGGSTFG